MKTKTWTYWDEHGSPEGVVPTELLGSDDGRWRSPTEFNYSKEHTLYLFPFRVLRPVLLSGQEESLHQFLGNSITVKEVVYYVLEIHDLRFESDVRHTVFDVLIGAYGKHTAPSLYLRRWPSTVMRHAQCVPSPLRATSKDVATNTRRVRPTAEVPIVGAQIELQDL